MSLPPYPFFIAMQFLTTIPVTLKELPRDEDMGRSLLYYPLVGLLIGGLLAVFAAGMSSFSTPVTAPLIAALVLFLWVLTTGGLHLDGLADSVDALMGGGGNRQKTLDLMKDPTSGPMGVASLILVLLVKFTALWLLIGVQNWLYILIVPLLGRTALIALFLTTPYVRKGGLGALICKHMPLQASVGVLTTIIAIVALIAGYGGLWSLLASAGVLMTLRIFFLSRLGGTTGDSAGALVELTEMVALITLVFASS